MSRFGQLHSLNCARAKLTLAILAPFCPSEDVSELPPIHMALVVMFTVPKCQGPVSTVIRAAELNDRHLRACVQHAHAPCTCSGMCGHAVTLHPLNDTSCSGCLCHRYPWFLPTFRNYSSVVLRSDSLRPFILHAYGGVYLDLDTGTQTISQGLE